LQSLGIDRDVVVKVVHVTEAGEQEVGTTTVKLRRPATTQSRGWNSKPRKPDCSTTSMRLEPVEWRAERRDNPRD